VKKFLTDLGLYAKEQVAANLPAILTATGVAAGGLIGKTKLPGPLKTLVKGTLAASLTVLTHNAGGPADPANSAVQRVLAKGPR